MARFVRFATGEGIGFGRVEQDRVYRIDGDMFGQWQDNGETFALEELTLLTPCQPGKIIAIGFNYRDHAEEFNVALPTEPTVFFKPVSCLAAQNQPVIYPKTLTKQVEYEAELVAVIGKRARNVSAEHALDYVFGYTIGNDVTARDMQTPTTQWGLCKGFDTFGVVGPWIETEVNPKAGLEISSWVNGERKQHSNTKNLIFDVPFLISYLSEVMTLEPGDIIFTGTPSGVGPVHPGDVMEMRIAGIGALKNTIQKAD